MREHSGADGGKNNNRNPTLRDAEQAKGRSGEAGRDDQQRLTLAAGQRSVARPIHA